MQILLYVVIEAIQNIDYRVNKVVKASKLVGNWYIALFHSILIFLKKLQTIENITNLVFVFRKYILVIKKGPNNTFFIIQ